MIDQYNADEVGLDERAEQFRAYLGFRWEDIDADKDLYDRFWNAVYDIHNYGALFYEVAATYGLD